MTPRPDAPLVSVVIPAYDAAWCVERAIDSVLAQAHRPLQVIVVNDGSRDGTAALLDGLDHPELEVIHQENRGLPAARNRGIQAARGRYVAFLDADDWWLEGKLDRQLAMMEADPGIDFSSTAAQVVDEDDRLLQTWRCPACADDLLRCIFQELAAVPGSGSGVMARRELFERSGLFDENLASLEDIDMWMRMAAVGRYRCLDEPLVKILRRSGSMSANLPVMRAAAIEVVRKNRRLLPPALRGAFWRNTLAGVHLDYAKGFWRSGRRLAAWRDLFQALILAPRRRGRLVLGLMRDMLLGRDF